MCVVQEREISAGTWGGWNGCAEGVCGGARGVSSDENTVLGRSDTIDEGTAERGLWICNGRLLKRGRITDTSSSGEMILSEGFSGECRGGGCVGDMMRSSDVSSRPTNESGANKEDDRLRRDVSGGRVGECVLGEGG